jgi:hypothetical protein
LFFLLMIWSSLRLDLYPPTSLTNITLRTIIE